MIRRPMIGMTELFIFMVSVLVFAGAGAAAPITEQAKIFRFIGASPGDSYFIVLDGIGRAVRKSIPDWSTIIEPGTAMSDILRIAQGDGDLTIAQNNIVADIIKKEGAEYEKICSLGAIDANIITCVSRDMPNEIAYNIVKAMIENYDYLKYLHVIQRNQTLDYMVNTGGVRLHPGAKIAYEEAGIMKY